MNQNSFTKIWIQNCNTKHRATDVYRCVFCVMAWNATFSTKRSNETKGIRTQRNAKMLWNTKKNIKNMQKPKIEIKVEPNWVRRKCHLFFALLNSINRTSLWVFHFRRLLFFFLFEFWRRKGITCFSLTYQLLLTWIASSLILANLANYRYASHSMRSFYWWLVFSIFAWHASRCAKMFHLCNLKRKKRMKGKKTKSSHVLYRLCNSFECVVCLWCSTYQKLPTIRFYVDFSSCNCSTRSIFFGFIFQRWQIIIKRKTKGKTIDAKTT